MTLGIQLVISFSLFLHFMNKIGHIQALRALAVFIVIGNHYKQSLDLFKYGYLGVDLFFVICGFIMVYTTRKSDGSFGYAYNFIIKRFSRVWPVYFVLSVLFFILFGGIDGFSQYDNIKYLLKSVLFYPYWQLQPVINAGWTLPFEVFFYMIFALSLAAGKYRWASISVLSIFTLVVCSLPVVRSHGSFDGFGAYLLMISEPINWCFYIGVVVGLVSTKNIPLHSRVYEFSLYVSIFMFLIFLTSIDQPQHGVLPGLIFGILLFGLNGLNDKKEINIPKSLVKLGDMSFSLYLCHEFVVEFFIRYIDQYKTDITMRVLIFFPYIALSILLGWLSWKYLENGLAVWAKDVLMGKVKVSAELPSIDKHTKA